ncbi:c-type cytochrome [Marivita sp. S2033]|uniref:c-type cytochrome n=1 Tax=Marivita sp. S2033 TaxID=3373187 RepID=UPI0039825044
MKKTVAIGVATALALGLGLSVVLSSGAQSADGALPYTDPASVAEGAKIYDAQCASCHGANLEGEADWKTPNADGYLPAPPHDASGHTWHHDDSLLIRIVTVGSEAVVGNGYKSTMIGFGDVLSDDEILNVLAFIKSTWPTEVQEIHSEINARN